MNDIQREINERYINKFNEFFSKIKGYESLEPITGKTAQSELAERIDNLASEENYDVALLMLTDWLDELKATLSV